MLEILFRGKREDNGVEVVGYFLKLNGEEPLHIIVDLEGQYHKVDPDTVVTDNNVGNKWIPVAERLPEDVYGKDRERIVVLVRTKSGNVSQCARCEDYEGIVDETLTKVEWIRNGKFYWSKCKKVTHWMPLPEPPKGD